MSSWEGKQWAVVVLVVLLVGVAITTSNTSPSSWATIRNQRQQQQQQQANSTRSSTALHVTDIYNRRNAAAPSNDEDVELIVDRAPHVSAGAEVSSSRSTSVVVAEGVNGTYAFAMRKFPEDPNRTMPILSPGLPAAPHFFPSRVVRSVPRSAQSTTKPPKLRRVLHGVYVDPYHADSCNVWEDPCETMADRSSLHLADSDANRPPINLYHCRAALAEPNVPECGGGVNRGHTVMYRHRNPGRWVFNSYAEFTGEPRPYSDIGRPASSPPAVNDPLPASAEWHFDPVTMDLCPENAPMIRMLVSRPVGSGYGLTNRVLAYAGTMSLATRIGRHMAMDKGVQRFPISSLVNLTGSVFPRAFRFVRDCTRFRSTEVRNRVAGKAKGAYQKIDRREVAKRPHRVLHRLDIAFASMRHIPVAKFHDMYLRYPYEQDQDLDANVGSIFCGLRFVDSIHAAAIRVIRRARELAWKSSQKTSRKYAALHFRQEKSDSVAMLRGRRAPTVEMAEAFLSDTIAPLLKSKGISVLVVCAGPLNSAMWNGLKSKGQLLGIHVISKADVLPTNTFNDFGTTSFEKEGASRIQVTSTDAAAADLIVLEKADVALLTTTSSFSSFVYAKRCGGSVQLGASITWNRTRTQLGLANDEASEAFPGRYFDNEGSGCTLVGQTYLYDAYLDGSFTGVVEYPCGYQFGEYIVAPPALVPRPPIERDVITFRYLPTSVLYTDPARNNR